MKRPLVAVCLLLAAVPLHAAYSYYYSSGLTSIYTSQWYENGDVIPSSNGAYGDGSLISKVAVPGGSNDYEVRTKLNLTSGFSLFLQYLRATSDANLGDPEGGSFYAVELGASDAAYATYSGSLTVYKRVGSNVTQLATASVGFPNGVVIRSIIRGSRLDVWVNDVWYISVTDTSLPTGKPGIGVSSSSSNTISSVKFGALDTVAPSPVSLQSIATYPLPATVDMQWQAAVDDANGIGVAHYLVYRGGVLIGETGGPEFTDDGVSPGQTYQYAVVARDYHLNDSSQTTFSVATPPSGTVDPRRVGVRPTGTYWGAGGEQLDMLSGNLNFSVPLVTAVNRNGSSLTFGLSYNSQLWRKDSTATWKLGRDVGYGFGWRLQAGSLTPYWEGVNLHHYTFIDSSGAEYRLDVQTSTTTWRSREGIYIKYDRVKNRIYFPDGSNWLMGSVSAGGEQDAGAMYPTVIQDSNGVRLC
jgi:hypothetical protein